MINYIAHNISNNHVANFVFLLEVTKKRRDGEDASQEM